MTNLHSHENTFSPQRTLYFLMDKICISFFIDLFVLGKHILWNKKTGALALYREQASSLSGARVGMDQRGLAWVICPAPRWCCVQGSYAVPCLVPSASEMAFGLCPFCDPYCMLFITCPNYTCTQLFSVPYSFFVSVARGDICQVWALQ